MKRNHSLAITPLALPSGSYLTHATLTLGYSDFTECTQTVHHFTY